MDDTASVVSTAAARNREISSYELSNDSTYVSKLLAKLRKGIAARGAYGIVGLSAEFKRLDAKVSRRAGVVSALEVGMKDMCSFLHDVIPGITVKDLEVLFMLVDEDGDGIVDMAMVVLSIRKVLGCTAQQFHDVLKKVRSKLPVITKSPFRKKSGAPARPTRGQLFRYLEMFELTQSEVLVLLDYCSVQETDVGDGGISAGRTEDAMSQFGGTSAAGLGSALGELDMEFLETILFSKLLPDNVAYPIVLSKFIEAATDTTKGAKSGTTGILRAIRQCKLVPNPKASEKSRSPARDVEEDDAYDGDEYDDGADPAVQAKLHHKEIENSILNQCIDETNFRQFIHLFQGGLAAGECDLLFSYINDPQFGLLSVRTLTDLFQTKGEVWSAVDMSLAVSKIRARLDTMRLHAMAARDFGCYAEVPLENMVQYIRQSGVSEFEVSDVEIEHVYRETRTVTAMVLLIRGPISAAREEFIKKLFHKLDDDDDGLITRDLMARAFDPDAAPNPKQARLIYDALLAYIGTLPKGEDVVGYSEVAYFWGNISAMFSSDADFTLMLWKAHSMQSKGRGEMSVARDRRSDSTAHLSLADGLRGGASATASGASFMRGNSHRSASQAGMIYGGGGGEGTLRQHHLSAHNQQQSFPNQMSIDRAFSRGMSGFSRSQSRF